MNWGHSSPNSKDSTVPETAPTANNTAKVFDQQWARVCQPGSPGAQKAPFGQEHQDRHADPEAG